MTLTDMSAPSEEHQVRVEASLAHLERQYEALNEVVIQQGRRLALLEKHLDRLNQQVHSANLEPMNPNEKPPHYGG